MRGRSGSADKIADPEDLEARRWTDAAGRKGWVVNIVAGDESGTYVERLVRLGPVEENRAR